MTTAVPRRLLTILLLGAAPSCSGGGTQPPDPGALEFSAPSVELDLDGTVTVTLANVGGQALGPVELVAGDLRDSRGAAIPGARLTVAPARVPTLNPGASAEVELGVTRAGPLAADRYTAALTARAGTEAQASLEGSFEIEATPGVEGLEILGAPPTARTGDVVPFQVEVRDAAGLLVQDATVMWTMEPADAGLLSADGRFVGYREGEVRLVAESGTGRDSVRLTLTPRGLAGSFSRLGAGVEETRYTSDLWIHGEYAYTGTWAVRPSGFGQSSGDRMLVWRISEATAPARVGEIVVDARTVNDVKVRAAGDLAILTHEGSDDGLNGITLLDLASPGEPRVVGRYTEGLSTGVHNVWIDGDHAYLVRDGAGAGLMVLDISEPARPRPVASFYGGSSFLHDVYVRDGLAFLSHWNAGLIVLDVGHGIAGGSPQNPVEVSRVSDLGGQTHNAWYWPEAGYVFVGEEDFPTPGVIHVIDMRDLRAPREVASYGVEGDMPHNVWLDEDTGILYAAWYSRGVRAIDVTGDLMGELHRQGRELAATRYNGGVAGCNRPSTDTCAWAPQLHRGILWVADMNRGLVALSPPG